MLPGSASIDTPADVRALKSVLPRLLKQALTAGRTFWAQHDEVVAEYARSTAVEEAIGSGRAARLRELLAGMPRKQAQTALDNAHIRESDESSTSGRCYGIAPALASFRPPSMLGAVLATGAALALARGARAARKKEGERVLGWVRRHLRKVDGLAWQTAYFAERLARKEPVAALTLFELALGADELRAPTLANALHAALSASNRLAVVPARHRRFLRTALERAGDDASVRFNAACLCMELGDSAAAVDHLVLALRRGARPDDARKEPLLRPLISDRRVASALAGRPKRPVARRGFVTHGRARRA